MFFEFLIKKFFQSCSARIGFTPMHDAFVALSVANDPLDQVFACQVPVHCIDQQHNIFMSATNANKVSRFEPVRTHHLGLKAQNFEKPIFTFGCFSLKAVYNSCKLQRLFDYEKFLIMCSFTHTNITVFLLKHLPTEIVIFIDVCYQMNCFSGNFFTCRGLFCQKPLTNLQMSKNLMKY